MQQSAVRMQPEPYPIFSRNHLIEPRLKSGKPAKRIAARLPDLPDSPDGICQASRIPVGNRTVDRRIIFRSVDGLNIAS